MGARLGYEDMADDGGEPVATLVVSPRQLRGVTIEPAEIPSLIDELPVLACVAARAAGETRVTGAAELRVKESDRIATVVGNLRAVGADAEELPDGFIVRGTADRALRGRIVTHGDHRIAMAFGILGALDGNEIDVDDRECVDVSYPGFWGPLLRASGADRVTPGFVNTCNRRSRPRPANRQPRNRSPNNWDFATPTRARSIVP